MEPAKPTEPSEPATPAEPEGKPATDPVAEDLFGDLPKKPAAKAKTAPAKKDTAEDLFGDLPTADPAKPATEPKADPAKDAAEDLFGAPATPAEPKATPKAAPVDPFSATSPRELPMRLWVDNTGNYQVRARLSVVMDGKVRLLKDTGRTTTVSLRRLSEADQQYVQRIASQFGQGEFVRLAAR